MNERIVVVGSANMDLIARVDRLPEKGETVLGGELAMALGGKGANQAVAAARLGAQVALVAAVGEDAYGQQAIAAYQADGVYTGYLIRASGAPTGVALIMVAPDGGNMIAVTPGANALLSPAHVQAAGPAIRDADCLLVQLEIPLETVEAALEIASRYQVHVILNPAPVKPIPASILQKTATLTPNQTEAASLAGVSAWDDLGALSELSLKTGVKNLVITLGERGAMIYGSRPQVIPAPPVTPVDTTAAGDAFNGALAVCLARGEPLERAVRYANIVAALSTTRPGAQPSLPKLDEVSAFVKQLNNPDDNWPAS